MFNSAPSSQQQSPEPKGFVGIENYLPDLDKIDIYSIGDASSSFLPNADDRLKKSQSEKAKQKLDSIKQSPWFMKMEEAQMYAGAFSRFATSNPNFLSP